jgi:RNA-directed DNA polymerase
MVQLAFQTASTAPGPPARRSLQSIIADINRVLQGWFAHFQHSRPFVFAPLDRWVLQRLRAILRKRTKRRGVAKG